MNDTPNNLLLSVLLRYTDSDYLAGIFKLFYIKNIYLLNSIEIPQGVNKMFEHTITMQKKPPSDPKLPPCRQRLRRKSQQFLLH
jgi:hypothetical protein